MFIYSEFIQNSDLILRCCLGLCKNKLSKTLQLIFYLILRNRIAL